MAIFKKIAAQGKYQDNQAIPDLIAYITRRDKTPSSFIGGVETNENDIAGSMMRVSNAFKKNSHIRLHHFIISFHPKEISSIRILIGIAEEICSFIGETYQIVYAIHEDSFFPHIHFVFNAVSYKNGERYRGGKKEYHDLVRMVRYFVRSFGVAELLPVNYYPNPYDPHE